MQPNIYTNDIIKKAISHKPTLQNILEAILRTEEMNKHTQEYRKKTNETIITETQRGLRTQTAKPINNPTLRRQSSTNTFKTTT